MWLLLLVSNCSIEAVKAKREWINHERLKWLKTLSSQQLLCLQLVMSLIMLRNSVLFEVYITIDAVTVAAMILIQLYVKI